jgi:hypothetical protein
VTQTEGFYAELDLARQADGELWRELRLIRRPRSDADPAPAQVVLGPVALEADLAMAMLQAKVLLGRAGWCADDFWQPDRTNSSYRVEVHQTGTEEA